MDCAMSFLIVDADGGAIRDCREIGTVGPKLPSLFGLLMREDIDVVLCGGIRREDRVVLETAGVEVNRGWIGEVKNVLKGFISGRRGGSSWVPDAPS
jgi:predicted Fe-Mo cluster-binding NifX family protein